MISNKSSSFVGQENAQGAYVVKGNNHHYQAAGASSQLKWLSQKFCRMYSKCLKNQCLRANVSLFSLDKTNFMKNYAQLMTVCGKQDVQQFPEAATGRIL